MKVFMLRNPSSNLGCSLGEKQTGIVPDEIGQALLDAGIAVRLDEPKQEPEIKTVPKPPEIAVAAAPVVAAIPEPPPIAKPEPVTVKPVPATDPKPVPKIEESIPAKPRAVSPPARAAVLEARKPKKDKEP